MRAGRLRDRIDLQEVNRTPDSWGDAIDAWSNYASNIPATVAPEKGGESTINMTTQATAAVVVYIRYSSDVAAVSPTHRVKFGNRYFDIQSVVNSGSRNRMLELHCIEQVT